MAEVKIITQKDFEEDYKKRLFSKIDHLCSSQTTLLSSVKQSKERLNIEIDNELPNIGITFNNKIVELLHTFQDSDLSMFSQFYENWGPKKINFISSSFIGDSIVFYMLTQVEEGVKSLVSFNNKLESLLNLEREKCNAFYTSNPIKRFSLMAKSFIKVPPELDFSCSEEDIFELNGYALAYISLDDYIYSFSLKDIIIPSLVDHIKRTKWDKLIIFDFLDNNIIPNFKKLGLSDLVPKLQQEIEKIYEISKEEQISDNDAR